MQPAVTDLTYLKRVTGGDTHLIRVFINSFLNDAPACMQALAKTCADQNWPDVKKAAHTFKGHVQYMGLSEIVPLVQEVMDDAAAQANLETIPSKIERIIAVSNAALPELRELLKSL